MTDSKTAQDTYRERLYKRRCGTCEHSERGPTVARLYWCPEMDNAVAECGICDLWKEKES